MYKRRAIVWFRQDLRLHDNEALTEALRHADEVIPVYVFDERLFQGSTRFGFPKIGKYRAKFILESVEDLRRSLQRLGSRLIVRVGKPEEEIFRIAQEVKSSWVFCNRERTYEEVQVQDALEQQLWSIGQEIRFSRGKMLYYTADLPFPVTHTPDVFTHFRKEIERYVRVREPLPVPTDRDFALLTVAVEPSELPTLQDFGHEPFEPDARAVIDFKGGESEGLRRLHYYLWETDLVKTYKETRNGLLGGDYSSKFSPWLAQGCLSPKQVYHELKRFEAARGSNESTYWLFFELLWRDFFRFMGKKHGNKIFFKGGTRGEADPRLRDNEQLFSQWAEGRTGVPFIDANMRELNATGFMSNRGRQNVASFLVKDLRINWQMGAEYFESLLIDYDVCSNWGNWNYVAGVGSDPREDRYFNILSQARRYDPQGEYVKCWIPELTGLPVDKIHQPDLLSYKEQEKLHVKIGADYPKAMIATSKWR
ncbi:MAG TPA: DASH family cryptochrome [Saprospiraceae bacterium]|nr:DASH family cryptochrome [Saprospiraceae bacterium]HMP22709.1 DASH family cryptochrome [Saprospiraceae bacterium]